MNDKIKLHLACGTVYLTDGYTNIDIQLPEAFLAKERPDLVKKNGTNFANYYKEHVGRNSFLSGVLQHKENVCDIFADIRKLPFEEGTVDEILGVQVFEHFSFVEGKQLLKYWISLLKQGGVMHLDVPDLDGTVDIYKTDKVWATRLLFGSQKNEYGVHRSMYNKETLGDLFYEMGLKDVTYLANMHTYPAFGVKGVKA